MPTLRRLRIRSTKGVATDTPNYFRLYKDSALAAWLNASNMIKNSSNPPDGTATSSWEDLSLNDNHAINGTGGEQPLLKTTIANGESSVLFDGADDKLTIASDATIDNVFESGGFFMAAIHPFSEGENNAGRIFSQGGGNSYLDLSNPADGKVKVGWKRNFSTNAGEWISAYPSVSLNEMNIIALAYNEDTTSNAPSIYVNSLTPLSLTETSSPVGTASNAATITLANAAVSNKSFDGYISELIFFKGKTLSTQEINDLFSYISSKYGVVLS